MTLSKVVGDLQQRGQKVTLLESPGRGPFHSTSGGETTSVKSMYFRPFIGVT